MAGGVLTGCMRRAASTGGAGGISQFIRNASPGSFSAAATASRTAAPGASGSSFTPASSSPQPPSGTLSSSLHWGSRVYAELLRDTDPIGGMVHKDVYRDPLQHHSPQYAPRNFSDGGAIGARHVLPGEEDILMPRASLDKAWRAQEQALWERDSKREREYLRGLSSTEERSQYIQSQQQQPHDNGVPLRLRMVASKNPEDMADQHFLGGGGTGAGAARQEFGSRFQAVPPSHRNAAAGGPSYSPSPLSSPLQRDELTSRMNEQSGAEQDDALAEYLHISKGERSRERFHFSLLQRRSRLPFEGYDTARWKAQRAGTSHGALRLQQLVAPSTMMEAHTQLQQNRVSPTSLEAAAARALSENTVVSEPVLGRALTDRAIDIHDAELSTAKKAATKQRAERFGLGRKGAALVTDGGPDQRVLKRGENDERLLDAFQFGANAYRQTPQDEHRIPTIRRDTQHGVGHLLQNRFDVERREDRLARGSEDLTERFMQHYGVPIPQQIDSFVFRHRNARDHRPLDYFKPFPHFRTQRLYQVYSDVMGFPLRPRPEFLEWELFTRYRAHHQQRRMLALRHGLEPKANEVAQERDARRAKLDALCEATPFDAAAAASATAASQLQEEEQRVDVEELRSYFGSYFLPSPTITTAVLSVPQGSAPSLYTYPLEDELKTPDTREHVMSARYFNQLLLSEAYMNHTNRSYVPAVKGKAPEVVLPLRQPPSMLKYFTDEELQVYERYVRMETRKQSSQWGRIQTGRRYVAEAGRYGRIEREGTAVTVVDLTPYQHQEATLEEAAGGGANSAAPLLTIALLEVEAQMGLWSSKPEAPQEVHGSLYHKPTPPRLVVPLRIVLDGGEVRETTDEEWSRLPLEEPAAALYNHTLDYGVAAYAYNHANYVETQDVIWEQQTAAGVEGWSPATHADGLTEGLPVRARRPLIQPGGREGTGSATLPSSSPTSLHLLGEYDRGVIVSYAHQPFFNPDPRHITVRFESDGQIASVPLTDTMIWQRRYAGPERVVGEQTRQYNPAGMRRFVNVVDPLKERQQNTATTGGSGGSHFLQKYISPRHQREDWLQRSQKEIGELDQWSRYDTTRAENFRPLSISHRRDYIRQGYVHRFTPWEWIAVQEADQPVLHHTLRTDDVGPSWFFRLCRYWRYKARPHGYLRHFDHTIRDLLQYVDGVTPWEQAKKIRTYWEVREHHPMSQFHRPEVSMHRNTAALLPSHLLETDKRTGKVKAVKDSVRDYRTTTPLPRWTQL